MVREIPRGIRFCTYSDIKIGCAVAPGTGQSPDSLTLSELPLHPFSCGLFVFLLDLIMSWCLVSPSRT